MRGHEEASGTAYVPPGLFEEWARKDPIARFETALDASRRCSASRSRARCARRSSDAIDALVDGRSARPSRDSTAERELADVYAPALGRGREPTPAAVPRRRSVRYVDAISDGAAARSCAATRRSS